MRQCANRLAFVLACATLAGLASYAGGMCVAGSGCFGACHNILILITNNDPNGTRFDDVFAYDDPGVCAPRIPDGSYPRVQPTVNPTTNKYVCTCINFNCSTTDKTDWQEGSQPCTCGTGQVIGRLVCGPRGGSS